MVYTDLPADMKKTRGTAAKVAKEMRDAGKQTRIKVVRTNIVLEYRDKPKKGATPGAWSQQLFT